MTRTALFRAATMVAVLGFGASAHAFGVQYVTEDPTLGYVGVIPTSSPAITVASDGESHFDPFNAGYDTSDGIQLNANWAPDPAYAKAFGANGWVQLPGTYTWVLPACINGVCENGNVQEPIGKWDFIGGGQWQPGTLSVVMLDSNGTWSDSVLVANDGPNGGATITFNSGVPEPAAWAFMLIGVAGVGYAARRSRKLATAA